MYVTALFLFFVCNCFFSNISIEATILNRFWVGAINTCTPLLFDCWCCAIIDCDYRVAGSLLLLLVLSEIIPGLARTLSDCRMSQFIHHVWQKPLLFMLILVGHDKWSSSLQINVTKDITSIVQWVKDFSMILFLYVLLLLTIFS